MSKTKMTFSTSIVFIILCVAMEITNCTRINNMRFDEVEYPETNSEEDYHYTHRFHPKHKQHQGSMDNAFYPNDALHVRKINFQEPPEKQREQYGPLQASDFEIKSIDKTKVQRKRTPLALPHNTVGVYDYKPHVNRLVPQMLEENSQENSIGMIRNNINRPLKENRIREIRRPTKTSKAGFNSVEGNFRVNPSIHLTTAKEKNVLQGHVISSSYAKEELQKEFTPGPPLKAEDFQNADLLVEDFPLHSSLWTDPIELAGAFEGDILGVNSSELTGRNAMLDLGKRWIDGTVPYVLSSAYSKPDRSVIAKAFSEYHKKTCIRFVPRSKERDYIYIQQGGGCSSHVGRQGGMQQLSLGSGCMFPGIVMHELMHAVGFWHEQSRPDRDDYIEISWDNIVVGMDYNFKKFNWNEVQSLDQEYDLGSVMHYGPFAFARDAKKPTIVPKNTTTGGSRLGQRVGFSEIDIRKVNKLYDCNEAGVVGVGPVTEPPLSIIEKARCKDESVYCNYWAATGECIRNPGWMLPNCKVSCGECAENMTSTTPAPAVDKPPCEDANDRCSIWSEAGHCIKNPTYMLQYCKYSCKKCSKQSFSSNQVYNTL